MSTRSFGQILEKSPVHSRRQSFIQSSLNFVRIKIYMESRPCLKLGHLGKKSRSVGQIIENHIVHIRSKISFTPKVIKALWSRLQSFEFSKLYDKVFVSPAKQKQDICIAFPVLMSLA